MSKVQHAKEEINEFVNDKKMKLINTFTFDEIDEFIENINKYRMMIKTKNEKKGKELFNILLNTLKYYNVVGIICTVFTFVLFTALYSISNKTNFTIGGYFLGASGFLYGIILLAKRNIELNEIKKFDIQ